MEEDETLMSQGGGATPMAYSNRQSVINSQVSNVNGKTSLLNKFAFGGGQSDPKSSAYKIRTPGEKAPSLDNYFTKTKSSLMRQNL